MKKTTKQQTPEAASAAPALSVMTVEEFDAVCESGSDNAPFMVPVPEFGAGKAFIVRQPDAETAVLLQESCSDKDGKLEKLKFACRLIYKCTVTPKLRPEHVDLMAKRNAKAVLRIASAIEHGGKKKEP